MSLKQWMIFGIKTEGADKADKDIEGIGKAAKSSSKNVDGLNKELDETGAKAGAVGKQGKSGMSLFSKGMQTGVGGLKMLKTAIIATGVGILVIAIGALVSNFQMSEKWTDKLRVASAALGGVMEVVSGIVETLGDWLVAAFENPQLAVDAFNEKMEIVWSVITGVGALIKGTFVLTLQTLGKWFIQTAIAAKKFFTFGLGDTTGMEAALKKVKNDIQETKQEITSAANQVAKPFVQAFEAGKSALKQFTAEAKLAANASMALERRQLMLEKAERKLGVQFAQSRQAIAEYKKDSDDITKSFEDRIKAAENASELETKLARNSLKLAQEQVSILKGKQAAGDKTLKTAEALAEAEIALADRQIESLGVQTELMTKLNGLKLEQEAAAVAAEDAEVARLDAMIARQIEADAVLESEYFNAVEAEKRKWAAVIAEAAAAGEMTIELQQARDTKLQQMSDAQDKKEIADARATTSAKLKIASDAVGVLIALNNAFAKSDEASQRKAFNRNKKLGIGQAVINTAIAISDALAKDSVAPFSRYASAAMAGALGLAQVATISRTKFDDSSFQIEDEVDDGGLGDFGGGGGGVAASAADTAPQIDLGFLGEGAGGSVQAYVISENVTNQQQADQLVADQTTL